MPTQSFDFQEPNIKHLLGFMGMSSVTFVHAEKLGFGPEAREAAITQAITRIGEVAAHQQEIPA